MFKNVGSLIEKLDSLFVEVCGKATFTANLDSQYCEADSLFAWDEAEGLFAKQRPISNKFLIR
ncbi:hypothetical protein [Paenibacillus sp. NEAU-GSW1]|uniref:hypothetical protein n=1 Tax=Paenibacillus sp. NEAU-GSW1 TaxID=2682486 RepID=UPI0012E0E934|nr:hypothetical protein [Paenibacillus sp. NEAU-GSW1]MUT68531.1 hypothetical protein [Paenibacillus sp. NEAU-GSW1]